MRTKRIVLGLAVACAFLAASCGETHMDQKRQQARQRWTETRAEVVVRVAEGHYQRGEFARASEQLQQVMASGVPYAPAYVLAARLSAAKGDLSQAHNYAKLARTTAPKSAEACYVLGTIEQALGHTDLAMAEFSSATTLAPDEPKYVLAESELLVTVGLPEVAAEHLANAAETDPGQAEVHAALGDVLLLLGRFREAVGSYRVALRLNPAERTVKERLATALFRCGAYAEAEPILATLAETEPDFAAGWIAAMRADCLMALGRTDQARALHLRRADGEPDDPVARVALAKCDIIQRQWASARSHLEAALACRPQDSETHALLGYVLVSEGRPGEALPHLRLALKDPKCAGRDTVQQLLTHAEKMTAGQTSQADPSATIVPQGDKG